MHFYDIGRTTGNAVQCCARQTRSSESDTAEIAGVTGHYAVQGDSRSLILMCDFPLVNNTNLRPILHPYVPFSSYRAVWAN